MTAQRQAHEDTPRTLGVALTLWIAAVLAAGAAGAVAKFPGTLIALLAAFGFAFATATYYLDANIRRAVDGSGLRALLAIAASLDAILIAAVAIALVKGTDPATLAPVPFALLALFVLPFAGAVHVALLDRALHAHAGETDKTSASHLAGAGR